MEHQFTADEKTSKSFYDELEKYMESKVLNSNGDFICAQADKCKKSCEDSGVVLHWGQLHHVGPLYDLQRDGKPFRIVVSGAEYGAICGENPDVPVPYSLQTRTNEISNLIPINQHMRGTLCLLQMLFGEKPVNGKREVKINGNDVSIFKVFTLANFLLCSAIPVGECRSYGAYTEHTIQNCRDHYQSMLEIVKPQILVLQGVRSREFFQERHGIALDYANSKIEQITISGNTTLILPLYHPSGRKNEYKWGGAGYSAINNYVKPAVEKLLTVYDKLYIA